MLFVTALTAAAAQVSVPLPFTAVPFTLQPMVVLIGGAALGSRLGFSSQVLYILAGVAGLPVFAASPILPQGAARLIGPTGGYLLAFPVAAFVAGALAERGFDRRYLTSVFAMAVGLAVIFVFGVTWLTLRHPGRFPRRDCDRPRAVPARRPSQICHRRRRAARCVADHRTYPRLLRRSSIS